MEFENEPRREFLNKAITSSLFLSLAPTLKANSEQKKSDSVQNSNINTQWKNKQSGMTYRMLGKSGMMLSEMGLGTYPYHTDECFPVLDASLEKGINYFDTASAYGSGKVEETLGRYFKKRKNRDKVFLSTKLSGYDKYGFAKEIYNNLSSAKQEAAKKKSEELIAEKRVLAPGYHHSYFAGQGQQLERRYLYHVVFKEYGMTKDWKNNIRNYAYQLLEGSLKRLKLDHVDVLHCPHGAAYPDLEDPFLEELFQEFKQKGLISASAISFHNDVAGNLSEVIRVGFYDAAMLAYNIANHAAVENLMFKAKQAGIGLIGMKAARLFILDDTPEWLYEKFDNAMPDKKRSKFSRAYQWSLQNPNMSCCLSQNETLEFLEDNLTAIGKNPNYPAFKG